MHRRIILTLDLDMLLSVFQSGNLEQETSDLKLKLKTSFMEILVLTDNCQIIQANIKHSSEMTYLCICCRICWL